MFGFRTLGARYRLAAANADFRRCKDEWNDAYARQDTRRMSVASANLRAARQKQLRAEIDLRAARRPRAIQAAR